MDVISFLDLHTTYVTLPPAGQGAGGGPYTVATNAARPCLFCCCCIKDEVFNSTRSGDCVAVLSKVLLRVK